VHQGGIRQQDVQDFPGRGALHFQVVLPESVGRYQVAPCQVGVRQSSTTIIYLSPSTGNSKDPKLPQKASIELESIGQVLDLPFPGKKPDLYF